MIKGIRHVGSFKILTGRPGARSLMGLSQPQAARRAQQ
jgi:hypothetical protein